MRYRGFFILLYFLAGALMMYSQELIVPTDTVLAVAGDTIVPAPADSTVLAADTVQQKQAGLDAPVAYQAKDSIVMTAGNWAYLFGDADVKYQTIGLQAEKIEMNMDSSLVFAKFGLDSIGDEFGYPLFKDGDQEYESKTMRYNFNTRKGYITDVITQQGEGYVTAGRTKKMDNDVLNMVGGQYTTCDEHDHPHFYIQMTKAKVRPKKNIVTGPVYMVIEDVPLYPIGLPFCFFPFSSTYSSGVIMPSYTDDSNRGFGLRDGGYYFALSDYMDLAVTGEIYTKGSWGLQAQSSYRKRYRFSGNFNAAYQVTKFSEKSLPDYSLNKDFRLNWTHSQDPKANPFRTFSASVNFSTSSFDRNKANGFLNPNSSDAISNTKGSSINITQRFPNSPLSLSATMNVNQRSSDSTVSVTLPNLTITLSRIFPFKRKNPIGKERWYEKISMSYSGYFRNSISTKEDQLFKSNLIKDWKNSMEHTIPVSATFTAFKYINISPSFNYKESWYTSKIDQEFDPQLNQLVNRDTTYGFYRIYNYNASLSASTTLYGFYKPLPFLGDKVQMIRHRFEPSVSISAAPDFGSGLFGFYNHYQYVNANGETTDLVYSPYAHNGTIPGRGKQGSLNFSLDNNVEMKIKSDRDTTGFRKISLIDKLSLGMSYNMAADSFKWSDLSANLRLKLSKSYTLNLNGTFDTYTYRADESGRPIRVDVPRWKAGKGIGRLRSTGTSFSYTFNNDTFKKWFGGKTDSNIPEDNIGEGELEDLTANEGASTDVPEENAGGRLRGKKKDTGEYDSDGYLITKIPWSLSFNYSMQLRYGDFDPAKLEYKYALTHALSFNGNIQPTKNWSFNFNATYDFDRGKISFMTCNVTRNLHCFQMSGSFVPVGPYKSYTFSIAVSSSLLKDLKYNQSSNIREGQGWY